MAVSNIDFSAVVADHYGDVYRFALSLTRDEAEAADLTQESFWRLADKALQIRDPRRAKSWLLTTLHREYTRRRRHLTQHPHADLDSVEWELPECEPVVADYVDGRTALEALSRVEETFRAPLALFYLEDFSYAEIAEILGVPIGTVMSRLSRGKIRLQQLLADQPTLATGARLIPFPRHVA